MWSSLENVSRALEKVCSTFGRNALKISTRSTSPNVSFKACVPLLTFCLMVRSSVRVGHEGPLLSLCPCQFPLWRRPVFVLCTELLPCWVRGIYDCSVFLLGWSLDHYVVSLSPGLFFILRSILSDMRIATPAFFGFPFAWKIFFHPLAFSLYVSLGLKWVSCSQRICGSCFCIHSASLCLWVGALNPFTFKVIIEVHVPTSIVLTVWGLIV